MLQSFLQKLITYSKWLFPAWIIIIALLTLVPGRALPHISWNFISIDKTVHIIMFAVLVFIGLLGVEYNKFSLGKRPKLTLLLGSLAYGYALELLQSFVPARTYDFADFTADCVGTLVGYGLFLGMSIILPKTR